ncbi:efflux RND transporter periplasmic adaptor subunit [Paracoccus luteus]|uniref:efflux RND transporter periplasmic adaptor subunit n=1 Tax=Paracoccus luteus TaxID=2508543 RepID=UPI001C70716B|nr:efflux RND transporter periplasmic adaptor subunit [Paracoccus luteus]
MSLFLRLAAAVLTLAVATGPAPAAEPAPAAAAAVAPTVTVAPAARSEVQARVPLSGTLVARSEVQVYPEVAGFQITALGAEAGDRVEKGQELARLSADTLRAQLAQAEAEHQRAQAGVSQAQSQIASAEAALTQAVTALERAQQLRRGGNTSQAALDQAVAAEAAAQAAAASATDGLAVAQAARAQAAAARDVAQLNMDRTVIRAPVDGRVTARAAQLGALSAAGGDPLFTLIADGTLEMQGEVIETALLDLRIGQRADLDVAGVGAVVGEVRQLPASVDPTTRLGEVRIALPADDRLRPGLFASGTITTARRIAVTVPATAVLADAAGERVQIVRDGTIDSRPVRAGLLWQGLREIAGGVAEGEMVVVRAGAFFRSGDPVIAVQADAATAAPADGPGAETLAGDQVGAAAPGGDAARAAPPAAAAPEKRPAATTRPAAKTRPASAPAMQSAPNAPAPAPAAEAPAMSASANAPAVSASADSPAMSASADAPAMSASADGPPSERGAP